VASNSALPGLSGAVSEFDTLRREAVSRLSDRSLTPVERNAAVSHSKEITAVLQMQKQYGDKPIPSAELRAALRPIQEDAGLTYAPGFELAQRAVLSDPKARAAAIEVVDEVWRKASEPQRRGKTNDVRDAVYEGMIKRGASEADACELARQTTLQWAAESTEGYDAAKTAVSLRQDLAGVLQKASPELRAAVELAIDKFSDPDFFLAELASAWREASALMQSPEQKYYTRDGKALVDHDRRFDLNRGMLLKAFLARLGVAEALPLRGQSNVIGDVIGTGLPLIDLGYLAGSAHGGDAHFIQQALLDKLLSTNSSPPKSVKEFFQLLGPDRVTVWDALLDRTSGADARFTCPEVLTTITDAMLQPADRVAEAGDRLRAFDRRSLHVTQDAGLALPADDNQWSEQQKNLVTKLSSMRRVYLDRYMEIPRPLRPYFSEQPVTKTAYRAAMIKVLVEGGATAQKAAAAADAAIIERDSSIADDKAKREDHFAKLGLTTKAQQKNFILQRDMIDKKVLSLQGPLVAKSRYLDETRALLGKYNVPPAVINDEIADADATYENAVATRAKWDATSPISATASNEEQARFTEARSALVQKYAAQAEPNVAAFKKEYVILLNKFKASGEQIKNRIDVAEQVLRAARSA
jgi:hypothetical protein